MFDQLALASERRASIRSHDTNAIRLVDGAADRFADLEIDDFAGRWLVQTRGGIFPEWLRSAREPLSLHWKQLGETKRPPVWLAGEKIDAPFSIRENGVCYWIDFTAGYSQGLFLDQRNNRAELRRIAAGKRVLNCFAYTCAFGVAAALGGARTVNVDLSKRYLEWGRRNYELNALDPGAHEFLHGDVLDWLERFRKLQRRFDIIILDPPTFSRGGAKGVFTISSGLGDLARRAAELLPAEGALFCSTNQRSLPAREFRNLLSKNLPGRWHFHAQPMPADFPGSPYLKACWLHRAELH